MLVRIVKMRFTEEGIPDFLRNFEIHKNEIRSSPGCQLLELYRDRLDPTVFFTYSYWDHEDALNQYRASDLFKEVWEKTKIHFNAKPEAWSVDKLVSLP
ncbi:antibiotic biosynthesis monooxygenase [Flavobacteriaceae bacterium F08102]|nr:antibiotic biosynthesis monooxygenase [Flavobacteriaceae bacterium F08102]